MIELIDRLALDVRQKLRNFRLSLPSLHVLRLVLQTVYLASLKTEEGQFVRASITYADPDLPDVDAPLRRRADYPSFTAFKIRPPLTVEMVVRLHREGLTGFDCPGIITVTMEGVGDLSIYHGDVFLGGLNGHHLVARESDALRSAMLASRIKPALASAASAVAHAVEIPAEVCSVELFEAWSNTIARLCIGLRRLGTGGSFLISPAPILNELEIVYPFPYRRLGDSMILKVLDDHYSSKIREKWIESISQVSPTPLVTEMELAEADAMDRESEITGAVKVVTSLAAADGLVLLNPTLGVIGFGVKIASGPRVETVYDGPDFTRKGVGAKRIVPSRYGTRHASMLRYCRSDPAAAGIVVSQDGHVRLIMSAGRSLTLWDNVKLLGYRSYSSRLAHAELNRRNYRNRHRHEASLGYTSMPKTIGALLKLGQNSAR